MPITYGTFQNPYSANSIWNLPIGSGAIYGDTSFQIGVNSAILFEYTGIHLINPSDPTRNVFAKVDVAGGPSAEVYCQATNVSGGIHFTVKIPDSLVYSVKRGNGIWCFYDGSAGTVMESYEWQRCTTASQSADHFSPRGPIALNSDGRNLPSGGCQFGSRMCASGGVLRQGELLGPDPIPHALKMLISTQAGTHYNGKTSVVIGTDGQNWRVKPGPAWYGMTHVSDSTNQPITGGNYATYWELGGISGQTPITWVPNRRFVYKAAGTGNMYIWPAISAQSGNGLNSNVMMGSLFALQPSFDVTQLLTIPARKIAQAFKTYGGYAVDTGGTAKPYWGVALEVHGNFGAVGGSPVQDEVWSTYNIDMARSNANLLWTMSPPTNTTPETVNFKADMDLIYSNLAVVVNTDLADGGTAPKGPGGPPAGDTTPPAKVLNLRKVG